MLQLTNKTQLKLILVFESLQTIQQKTPSITSVVRTLNFALKKNKEYIMECDRVYYFHSIECTTTEYLEPNANGLKTCVHCAGIFDAEGKGIAVLDKRLDVPRLP